MFTCFTSTIRVFTISFIFFFPGLILAQYSFSPSTTFIHNTYFEAIDFDGITIKNESDSVINLMWNFVSVDTIEGCVFDMCASSECHLGIPPWGYFPPLAIGDTGWLYMHFWTGNTIGTNTARVYVYEPKDPDNGDTLTFILNVLGPNLNIANSRMLFPLSFYPNPASDLINIDTENESKYSVSVYNSIGQRFLKTSKTGKAQIPIENLKPGYYTLIFEDEKGNLKKEKLLKIKPD